MAPCRYQAALLLQCRVIQVLVDCLKESCRSWMAKHLVIPLDNGIKQCIGDAYASSAVLAVLENKFAVVAKGEYLVIVRPRAKLAMKAIVLRLGRF